MQLSSMETERKKKKKRGAGKNEIKKYKEEMGFKKSPKRQEAISMRQLSTAWLVDEKKLVKDILLTTTASDHTINNNKTNNMNMNMNMNMKMMKLEEKNVAVVLPGRITNVKFLPTKHMRMLVAGNRYGNLGFWNMDHNQDDDDLLHNGIYVFYPHSAPVSGISLHPSSLQKIVTSCYNGFIRLLDVEKESFDLSYSSQYQIFSICRPFDHLNSLFFGESYGSLGLLDLRRSSSIMSRNLHWDKINTIDFNSQNQNLMATSSADGTACIWDVRKLDQPHPQSLKIIRHKKPVNSAYFSPSGTLLATTSIDDKIGLLSGKDYEVESMIYHSNCTSRWISSFRGIWGWDDRYMMVANHKKGVDIVSAVEKKLEYTLESNKVTSGIPCRLDAHPMMPGLLAGATAGGQVCVWDL